MRPGNPAQLVSRLRSDRPPSAGQQFSTGITVAHYVDGCRVGKKRLDDGEGSPCSVVLPFAWDFVSCRSIDATKIHKGCRAMYVCCRKHIDSISFNVEKVWR